MKKNTIRALKDAGHDDKLGVITFGPEFLHDPDLIEWMHHCVLAFDEDGEGFKRDPSFKQLVDDFASRLLFAFKHRAEEDATASVHSFVRALEAVLRREVNTAGHADDVWQEFGENRKQRTTTLNEVLQYLRLHHPTLRISKAQIRRMLRNFKIPWRPDRPGRRRQS